MRTIFYTLLLALLTINLTAYGSTCGEVFHDGFDQDGALPTTWTEYNTAGRVSISGGEMQFNYNNTHPSAYRTFTPVSDVFTYSFTIKSQKNWINVRMNLYSDNDQLITGMVFGNNGTKNIQYATSTDINGIPNGFTKLLNTNFASNTSYIISMTVSTNSKTIDFYINGELKASDVPFLNSSSSNFAKIDIQQNGMFGGSGIFYVDNVKTIQDNIIRDALQTTIDNAESHISSITIGTGTAEYPQSAVDAFQSSIDNAKLVIGDCNATQNEVNTAVTTLSNDITTFDDSRSWQKLDITVTVDPTQFLCEKKPEWFGGNNTYNASGQGLWNSTNNRCNYQVIDLANYTGAGGYRFPGGTMANLYHWKRAIGPVDERIDNLNSHGDAGPLSNEFGPDEFGHMLGNTPLNHGVIVVSFNYDTPIDAADFVEYMNAEVGANPNGGIDWAQKRADNGHPEPYNIKYWEIGNELYGNWELSVCNYPADGDENRGGDKIVNGLVDIYVNGGYRDFTNQRAVKKTTWKKENCVVNGSANQEFYAKFAPVDLSSPFTLSINGTTWTRVTDFTNSGAADIHYTVDAQSGKITFGDGTNGSNPSGNHNIVLDYRSGRHAGFYEYYDAMKAVDPTIEVISCWEEEAFYQKMAQINKPYDGVSKHYYPGGTPDAGDEFKMTMRKAVNFKGKISSHITHVNKYNNASLSGINVQQHLTEFGANPTIAVAPYLCTMWHDVINSYPDKVGNMMVHSYFKNDNTPMVNTNGKFVAAKAIPYHIFGHLHQDNFVQASYQGGSYTYNSTVIKNSYPTASINKEGNIITLVIPNSRDAHILNANIDISNYAFDNNLVKGKKWIAKAYDIYKTNTTGSPKEVRIEGPFDIDLSANNTDDILPYSVAIYQWIEEDIDFVSDLTADGSSDDFLMDKGYSAPDDLIVNGITYEKGLSIPAGNSVIYPLDKKYETFYTKIGLDDAFPGGTVKVNIYIDDILTYEGAEISANSPTTTLRLDVTEATTIRIETIETINGGVDNYVIFGDAKAMKKDNGTGIGDLVKDNGRIKTWPNPTSSKINIALPFMDSGHMELFDLSGASVLSRQYHKQQNITLPIQHIGEGVYLLVIYGEETVYSKKIIKGN